MLILKHCEFCDRRRPVWKFVTWCDMKMCNSCRDEQKTISEIEWEAMQKRIGTEDELLSDILRRDMSKDEFKMVRFPQKMRDELNTRMSKAFERIRMETRISHARAWEASRHVYINF